MNHLTFNPTPEQRRNLTILADHLATGKTNHEFDMWNYSDEGFDPGEMPSCGTVACAAGHGPSLGIAPKNGEYWHEYVGRVFIGDDENAHFWMFGSDWTDGDNTPQGAAARIRYALEHGIPENAWDQCIGNAPLCYSVEGEE